MLYPEKYNDMDDGALLKEYQANGNKVIVGIIYKRYSHLVFGLCMKYLKDEEEAEDMVIHIFTKLMDDLTKHTVEYFKSWLYTYSKNHCLMHLRTMQSKLKKELEYQVNAKTLMENDEDLHQNAKDKEEQYAALEVAIEQLNEEQKVCIRLFYLKQKSYQEIAEETGYSLNNVKSFIQNGKRNLKIKLMDAQGGGAGIVALLLLLSNMMN